MSIGNLEIRRFWSCEGLLLSVAALLGITAMAKLISVMGDAAILDRANPLLGFLSNRQMLFLAAGLELGVAGWIVLGAAALRPKLEGILWLGAIFLVYRGGLWAAGYEGECSCLGTVAGGVGLSPEAANWLMRLVLAYMLLPTAMLWNSLGRGTRVPWAEVKTEAPVPENQK